MLRKFSKRRSYVVNPKETMSADMNRDILRSIDGLMREDRIRTRQTFGKTVPIVNDIFCALGNHDVRFEFNPLTPDDCRCEKISENEYSLLCSLKELPDDELRVEGDEWHGAFTVRLSTKYEDSCDKACWDDICLPPDALGRRHFSTSKLLKVLIDGVKYAIEDIIGTDVSGVLAKCEIKNDQIVLTVKVEEEHLNLNLLPSIQLSQKTTKAHALESKITRISNHLKITNTEPVYLVAKPNSNYPEELWRIAVNNIENQIVNKVTAVTECGNHCLFAVNLLNEQFLLAEKVIPLPFQYIRLALLAEFLKCPHEHQWKVRHFTERIEGVLRSLENHLYRKEFKNIFTGVDILGNQKPENLAELSLHVGSLRSRFRDFLLNLNK